MNGIRTAISGLEIMSIEEAKKVELGILKEFSRICNEHSINYSLAYGTLLGAVRHKGFIPWDDDIDVMMLREDYNRFIEVAHKELSCGKYKVISREINDDYFAPLAKIYDDNTIVVQHYGQNENIAIGVYIDLFVMDYLPECSQETFYNNAELLRRKWAFSVRKIFARHMSRNTFTDICGSVYALPYKIRGYKFYRDRYIDFSAQYCGNGENVAVIVYGEGLEKERIKKSRMVNLETIKFEDSEYLCLENPDTYLHQMYGDYMELPPIEQRIGKHPNNYYWKR